MISRTGYTGEDGFELSIGAGVALGIWEALMEAGKPLGIVAAGLGARDTLRLEAGMPLYGQEMDEATQPPEAGLAWTVDAKGDRKFVGRAALAVMDTHLATHKFFVAERYTIADIALYAYTHVAAEGGHDLKPYRAVSAWLARVAAQAGHVKITDRP